MLWQAVGMAAIVGVTGALSAATAGVLIVAAIPCNWVALVISNAVFLLFPYRLKFGDPGAMVFMGRAMLGSLLRMFAIALALGVAAAAFGLVLWVTSARTVAALAALVVLAVECVALTYLVARLFERFDVARDIPS
jgi:hypothetical protein